MGSLSVISHPHPSSLIYRTPPRLPPSLPMPDKFFDILKFCNFSVLNIKEMFKPMLNTAFEIHFHVHYLHLTVRPSSALRAAPAEFLKSHSNPISFGHR